MRSGTLILTCLFLAGLVVGCSKPDPLYPVSGRVLLDGKPLHKGDVVFVPDDTKGNTHLQFGMGKIDADGAYTASTFQQDGVRPGWYKVMVLATKNEPQESPSWVPIWIVPVKYTKPETTDLSVEITVKPGPKQYDLALQN